VSQTDEMVGGKRKRVGEVHVVVYTVWCMQPWGHVGGAHRCVKEQGWACRLVQVGWLRWATHIPLCTWVGACGLAHACEVHRVMHMA
jgi:hypothetical protein